MQIEIVRMVTIQLDPLSKSGPTHVNITNFWVISLNTSQLQSRQISLQQTFSFACIQFASFNGITMVSSKTFRSKYN